MKARIEKKLSKRLVEIAPSLFPNAWRDEEISELAYEQRTSVRHVMSVGGGVDYWGEGMDAYACWDLYKMNWMWYGDFKPYPAGHKHEGYPNTEGFRPTTQNLLKLAGAQQSRAAKKAVRYK